MSWADLPDCADIPRYYRLVVLAGYGPGGDLVQVEDSGANDAAGIMDVVGVGFGRIVALCHLLAHLIP